MKLLSALQDYLQPLRADLVTAYKGGLSSGLDVLNARIALFRPTHTAAPQQKNIPAQPPTLRGGLDELTTTLTDGHTFIAAHQFEAAGGIALTVTGALLLRRK